MSACQLYRHYNYLSAGRHSQSDQFENVHCYLHLICDAKQ